MTEVGAVVLTGLVLAFVAGLVGLVLWRVERRSRELRAAATARCDARLGSARCRRPVWEHDVERADGVALQHRSQATVWTEAP